MNYTELRNLIKRLSQNNSFDIASSKLSEVFFNISDNECALIMMDIGAIPEDIPFDSSEEKLYSKASELLLAKIFQILGLKSSEIKTRSDCADVIAKSQYHNYSLVADAKAFRMSRTAKNQKDLKVSSMAHWRGDNDYAILVCPFFQYPSTASQIYKQAIDDNICLLSWEFFSFLILQSIKETPHFSLSNIWDISNIISQKTIASNAKQCFFQIQNQILSEQCKLFDQKEYDGFFVKAKRKIVHRGEQEIQYWENQIALINEYSKEQAINALLDTLGLSKKIDSIKGFIHRIQ